MSLVEWDDVVLDKEVRRFGVKDIVMEKHQLRWYGQVKGRDKENN